MVLVPKTTRWSIQSRYQAPSTMPVAPSTAALGLLANMPARIGNSPTNPFSPGTAIDPSAERMKKNARSGSRFQSPPNSAISRV